MKFTLNSSIIALTVLFTSLFNLSVFAHSYSIVELLGPDEDRYFLLVKDNHELATLEENLEELEAIKLKLRELNKGRRGTLVLTESMWTFGKEFKKPEIESALTHMRNVLAPKVKTQLTLDPRLLAKYRNSVSYIDFSLPAEIANMHGNKFVRGESIDPRLPIVKLSRLLDNKQAQKIKVSLKEVFDVANNAKKQIEAIYESASENDIYEFNKEFWNVVEGLALEVETFEAMLVNSVTKDDERLNITLTKKNVKAQLNGGEIEKLKLAVVLDPSYLRAHAWAQDIATLHRIVARKTPEVVIIVGGGAHLDLIEKALLGLGCTMREKTGTSTEEILSVSLDESSVLSLAPGRIKKELHEQLIDGIANSLSVITLEEDEESTESEKKNCVPSLASHLCNAVDCNKSAPLTCSRCQAAHYCSKDCQLKHWGIHKLTCRQHHDK